jgi:hypothetical protein
VARFYDFVFRGPAPDYKTETFRGYGNTRRSAQVSARHKLRTALKLESTSNWLMVKSTFAGREG